MGEVERNSCKHLFFNIRAKGGGGCEGMDGENGTRKTNRGGRGNGVVNGYPRNRVQEGWDGGGAGWRSAARGDGENILKRQMHSVQGFAKEGGNNDLQHKRELQSVYNEAERAHAHTTPHPPTPLTPRDQSKGGGRGEGQAVSLCSPHITTNRARVHTHSGGTFQAVAIVADKKQPSPQAVQPTS